ncbi:MAG: lipoate--protein ligase family protein [Acidiferrobacter sp.]
MQLLQPTDNRGILPICYFHALARLGEEGLLLIEPAAPFVSLGSFDAKENVDLEYCRRWGIPVMRRETGGGTVLLGPGQVFYTLVIKRPHPPVPVSVNDAYRHLSQAPIGVYGRYGVTTHLRPINDIATTDGRKIGGQGAGDINGFFCFVGSILVDFDIGLMHRVIHLPDERLRPAMRAALDRGMTSIVAKTGHRPETSDIKKALAAAFAPLIGGLEARALPTRLQALACEMADELRAGVFSEDTGAPPVLFKVHEDLHLCQRTIAGEMGLLAISVTVQNNCIAAATISDTTGNGVFQSLPSLVGCPFTAADISARRPALDAFGITTPAFVAALFSRR